MNPTNANDEQMSPQMVGLAAYLRAEAYGLPLRSDSRDCLMAWAKQVEAALSQPASEPVAFMHCDTQGALCVEVLKWPQMRVGQTVWLTAIESDAAPRINEGRKWAEDDPEMAAVFADAAPPAAVGDVTDAMVDIALSECGPHFGPDLSAPAKRILMCGAIAAALRERVS